MGLPPPSCPGPAQGSLLRRTSPASDTAKPRLSCLTIDPNSPHVPSPFPLVTRETLKELDLEAILRNPQLRHDLLFDPGLQFRPTSGRRKRELYDSYWRAVLRELETGCTCVSFNLEGGPHERVCICNGLPLPPSSPHWLVWIHAQDVVTMRMPSRIRPLLQELLEVIISVIQPSLHSAPQSGLDASSSIATHVRQHPSQIESLRQVFDLDLIEQELQHRVFDPSGLFRVIGDLLKCHCAPMRDRAVESMVAAAQSCAPGAGGGKADAVKAIRMCFEVLELMKLDIANHQLQALRPFLVHTSASYELKAFQENQGSGELSISHTRRWLQDAHRVLGSLQSPLIYQETRARMNYRSLRCRGDQIHLAALRALTDLVFVPPIPIVSSPTSEPSATPTLLSHASDIMPSYPETLYLDHSRLHVLSKDAADLTALYMLLMLYRQLVHSDSGIGSKNYAAKMDDAELVKIKREIWDIGPHRMGYCFSREWHERGKPSQSVISSAEADDQDSQWVKWHSCMRDVILQIAMRATAARNPSSPPTSPDEHMLRLAECWADSNMKPGSPLSVLLRDRVRNAVMDVVITQARLPSQRSTTTLPQKPSEGLPDSVFAGAGLEPLATEIRHLGERLAKLAVIHLNTYLPLYEQEGFLDSSL
ncbi:Tcp11-domain-containing protein [Heliocybe sulcata]|uniref:Tcp11-domain-containing protein n=1 Tax=Heliocybe sulcata TaxID=5364 RepID=A0A5C3N536_9AGAM|nr:Tcp11-domain-containing protein [Heliocybe sulcata]